jgi:hypothetical protein
VAIPENSRLYPLGLRCEITGPADGCAGDTSGVYSMPYRSYCVSMLDKIDAALRSPYQYPEMPKRQVASFDCMALGVKARDPVTDTTAGLPDSLTLWSNVVAPGKFFDFDRYNPGGFTYVEIYDPAYWMKRDLLQSQSCFHPMYRMRARSKQSVLDNQVFAIWLTKYETVTPDVLSGVAVAAPSAHFGTELWFFNRAQVNEITNVLFGKWRILK